MTWKIINEVNGRKNCCNRSKLKLSSQEERVKEKHFKDLLGKPPKTYDEEIISIFTEELNTTKSHFVTNKLQAAIKKH